MAKKIIALLVVLLIGIFSEIGFEMGRISEKRIWQVKLIQLQQELDWLKSQLEMYYPPLPEKIYGTAGTVEEVGDKFLVIESKVQTSQFPKPEGKEFEEKKIKVNVVQETEIFRLKEIGEASPRPFEKIASNFEDIKTGVYVVVISKENIKDKKEVIAAEIQILD